MKSRHELWLWLLPIFIFQGSCCFAKTAGSPYKSLIIFGDSLSDVGSYAVPAVTELGGGKFSINSANSRIWVEMLSENLGLPAPCAARTGLAGTLFGSFTIIDHQFCFNYAQGGSRVTHRVGIGNIESTLPGSRAGALTVPLLTQIENHLFKAGAFSNEDLVIVWGGNNDILANILYSNSAQSIRIVADELILYIKNLIIAKGAKRVLVLNIADIRDTPFGLSLTQSVQSKINDMIMVFNHDLAAGLIELKENVLLIDIYEQGHVWQQDPLAFGVTNITQPACDLQKTLYPSVLLCTLDTLIHSDISGYFFADLVHPAPKGHELIANFVAQAMKKNGWY